MIQDRRKEIGCEYTDRIEVGIVTESAEFAAAIEQFRDYIMAGNAARIGHVQAAGGDRIESKLGDALQVYVRV